jgi:hypothetical protein
MKEVLIQQRTNKSVPTHLFNSMHKALKKSLQDMTTTISNLLSP